jgi:nicotinamidase-related amidase
MALTQLDIVPALVVIDLQKGVLGLQTVHPTAGIVEQAARLAAAFRARNLPVVLVDVAGRAPGRTDNVSNFRPTAADWRDLAAELDPQPGDIRVTKMNVGAFYGTSLELHLRRRGVTQIVLAGIATSSGVEATARAGYDHGYNVVTVTDAMTDTDAEAHRHAVETQFRKISETAITEDVLKLLATRG